MDTGWIKIERSIMTEWIYSDPEAFKLYTHLLFKAAFQERQEFFGNELITIYPGQLITGRKQLNRETGLSEQTIRTILSKLEKCHKINQHSTKIGTLISINYGGYEKKTNQDSTKVQPSINQDSTTIKEIKKETTKEIIKTKELDFDWLDHELIIWINQSCPRVASMKKPLDNNSAEKLCEEFGIDAVKQVILDMENYAPLLKKSIDTNLTCRNWLNRRNQKPQTNAISQNGSPAKNNRSDEIFKWMQEQRDNLNLT